MKNLIVTVGLPRSGKTTWARKASSKLNAPIVSPDSVRLSIHGKRFIAAAEPIVWATVYAMTGALFLAGHDTVIVDATNVSRRRRMGWAEYAKSVNAVVWFKVFSVPKHVCIERAQASGDAEIIPVIERMAGEWESLSEDDPRCTLDWKDAAEESSPAVPAS